MDMHSLKKSASYDVEVLLQHLFLPKTLEGSKSYQDEKEGNVLSKTEYCKVCPQSLLVN